MQLNSSDKNLSLLAASLEKSPAFLAYFNLQTLKKLTLAALHVRFILFLFFLNKK